MPVAGVDEAGCAPLAGPVVAAAVILPPGAEVEPDLAGLTDSKMLGKAARERLYAVIRSIGMVGVGAASVAEIETLNIRRADMLAMSRAVAALPTRPGHLLVDGNAAPVTDIPVTTIVGGDRRCLSISAASVVAKVTRDHIMSGLAIRHPGYGWERNAGYPAPDHYIALLRQGITAHHRRTFTPLTEVDVTGRPTFGERAPVAEAGLELIFLRRDLTAAVIAGTNTVVAVFQCRSGAWIGRRATSAAAGDATIPAHLLKLCNTTLDAMTPAAVIEVLNVAARVG
ncbi:ribonuclease HII [Fodinicurvata sp. EGI_FJ10296]|uniref:ribonuclease HII n=1 Tax=Fodinicurvata sp. EGI_FJ10296 TaxID=3231908 RepID=UPI0034561FCB